MTDAPPDGAGPRRRSFLVKRLDRERWWPITTEMDDGELDAALREDGFDPATRKLMRGGAAPSDHAESATLAESRWVRVMADVCADGVWDKDGFPCLVEDLPVSPGLRARLLEWQEWYDMDSDRDHEEEAEPFDVTAFASAGLVIAEAVKAELPDWTVVYFDESRIGQPLSVCQYEILLPAVGTPDP